MKWGPLEHGDIADADRVYQVIQRYRPGAVMHFAAYIDSAESVLRPEKYYQNNVAGSLSLLGAMRRAAVKQLVFSSTAAVYSIPHSTPIEENHPLQPINPYGSSKLTVEKAVLEHAAEQGFNVAILRYFNAAGADYRAGIGESHEPETHLIPRVLAAASGRSDSVMVHGSDYPTPDGTCIRDYVHVVDLAEAHLLALQWTMDRSEPGIFNLGGGNGASVRQVIDVARHITQRPIPVRLGPRRAGDPTVLLSDIGRAFRDLGWRPRRSSLEQMVSDAWQWHLLQAG